MINLTKIQSKCKPGNENCSMKSEQDFKNACQTCIDKYSKWVEVHNESLINKSRYYND